jgi:hypothetical protein
MSDVNVGIETRLNNAGTKSLEKDLDNAKLMTQALTKATEEQNRAATDATAVTEKKSDAEADSAESMRNLHGVGQQLNAALNGNITAMTRSIPVTKEFAAQLQGAFSILGAATFGAGVGTAIYKSLVKPLLDAKFALNDIQTEAGKTAIAISKALSDEHVTRMNDIANAAKRLAAGYSAATTALENEIAFTRKLIDANYELEEAKLKNMPEGVARDKAQAELKARKTNQQLASDESDAKKRRELAEEEVRATSMHRQAALSELDRFKEQAGEKIPGLREQFDKIKGLAVASENPLIRQVFPKVAGTIQSRFGELSNELDEAYRQSRQGSPDTIKKAQDAIEADVKAHAKLKAAQRAEEQIAQIVSPRREAVGITLGADIRGINQEEAARQAKAKAEAEKKSLEDEKQRIEDERKATKERIELHGDRALPEQLRAQREKGEAQSAGSLLSQSPSLANRRNYERELAEAKEAEKRANDVIAALTNTLTKLNDRYKQVEERIRNLPIQ